MLTLFPVLPPRSDDTRLRQRMLALPRTRVVGVPQGDMTAAMFELIFMAFWLMGVDYSVVPRSLDGPSSLFFLALAVFVFYSWLRGWWREIQNRGLVSSGECTIGWVDSQTTVRRQRSQTSEITYVFTDVRGQTWHGEGTDRTKKYVPQMALAIFYDSRNPARNVAACATIWKVLGLDSEPLDVV